MNRHAKSDVRMAAIAGWGLLTDEQKASDRLHIAADAIDLTNYDKVTVGFATGKHIIAPLTIKFQDLAEVANIYLDVLREQANG